MKTARQRRQSVEEAAAIVADPRSYSRPENVDSAFALLRKSSPVHWVDAGGIRPFWALTRHAEILHVEQRPELFLAEPRTVLSHELADVALCQLTGRDPALRPLTHMDAPDHRFYRQLISRHFGASRLACLEPTIHKLAAEVADQIAASETCDFAELAAPFALRVIMTLLGLPDREWPHLLELTRNLLGVDDPLRRTKELPSEAIESALRGYRDFFDDVTHNSERLPDDGLLKALLDASIDGAPIPYFERISMFILLLTGGHDTTTFAVTGGLEALLSNRTQADVLCSRPELLDRAIDEILRWTSPLRHFVRTATEDTEVGGSRVRAGDALALFYCSANRDESIFEDSGQFIVTRERNAHIAFGNGPHTCLGRHLAKWEIRVLFDKLLRLLPTLSLAGAPHWSRSLFVGGVMKLPILNSAQH